MTWSAPAVVSRFATSLAGQYDNSQFKDSNRHAPRHRTTHLAVMGARDLSFLSCRAYGKHGMTAVMRRAEAVRQAEMRMRSSIRWSLTCNQGSKGMCGRVSKLTPL